MSTTVVLFDPNAPDGAKFGSPAVRRELGIVVPSSLEPGSVTETKIADGAVTNEKIGPGAVESENIAVGGVKSTNLDAGAVTAAAVAAGAITAEKCGVGAVASYDSTGNPVTLKIVKISFNVYQAITTPDPNTLYIVTDT